MQESATRQALGKRGEHVAAEFYARRGATILARNIHYPVGELDLIVREPNGTVVFVEVKTRSSGAYGNAESVTRSKLAKMRKAAARWLLDRPYSLVRFDVIALTATGDEFALDLFEGVEDGAC
ncbi:YraN family protein [Corynebacterium lubricantis]|uniref:YraN family protein n=1 Tax=Corynebacterium lubricantis TaxID=541095 RepID=UPI00037CE6AE|nr:YraN family protein [Corynebacterium lubricantis]